MDSGKSKKTHYIPIRNSSWKRIMSQKMPRETYSDVIDALFLSKSRGFKFGALKCRACDSAMDEMTDDSGATESETEGQMAERIAGNKRLFQCAKCGNAVLIEM